MGGSSIDCHSNYAPDINQSKDIALKPGVGDNQLNAILSSLSEAMNKSSENSGMDREIAALRKENKAMREVSTEMLTGRFQSYDESGGAGDANRRGGSFSFALARSEVRSTEDTGGKQRGDNAAGLDSKLDPIDAKQNDRLAALEKKLAGDKTEPIEDRQNQRLAALEAKLGGAEAGSTAKGPSDKRPPVDDLQNDRLTALENKLSDKSTSLYEYSKNTRQYLEQKQAERDSPPKADTASVATDRTDVKTGLPTKSTGTDSRLASDSGYDKKQNAKLDMIEQRLRNAGFDIPKASSYAAGDVGQDQRMKDLSKAIEQYNHNYSTEPTKHDGDQDKQLGDMLAKLNTASNKRFDAYTDEMDAIFFKK